MSKKKLTISMLVCGRDTTIRCLDSLVPILEGMDAELILVDTGCGEELRRKLTEYTDQIIPFTWCDDFSAARNVGVRAAKGEWFLYIDDDEWFENPEVLIQFFKSGQYKKYGCVNYIQRNFYDTDMVHYDDFWASRMMRLEEDTRFKSKIHEYLYPIRGEAYNLPLIANHTGYIFQTQEAKQKHYERNVPLLLEMIGEEPKRLRWRVQLMQEYRSVRDYQSMYDFGVECLEFTKDIDEKKDNWDIGTFYAGAAEGKFFLKEYEDGIAMADRGLADPRMNEMCHAYMYLCKATIYSYQEKWAEAEDCAHRYFRIKKELGKNEIRLANQKGSLLVGEAFDVFPLQRMYSILCMCELKRKDTRRLKKYIGQMGWEKNRVYLFDGFLEAIAEAMATMPLQPDFVEIAQKAWDSAVIQPKFFIAVQAWEERDTDCFHQLLRVIARVEGQQWYLHYARILVADLDGKTESLEEEFQIFLHRIPNVFLCPENITDIMRKYHVPMEDKYLSVPFEKWCANLSEYLTRSNFKDVILKKLEFSHMKTREDVRYGYMEIRIAELKVLYSVREQEFPKKRETLELFAGKAMEFLRTYYKESVFSEEPELLPAYGQAALRVEKALALETSEPKEALALYREAVTVCPQWADAMKAYMQAFGQERERREKAAKDEMRRLRTRIMEEVHNCVKQKRYEEALGIVNQLKQMEPNDLETAELSLRIRLAMLGA